MNLLSKKSFPVIYAANRSRLKTEVWELRFGSLIGIASILMTVIVNRYLQTGLPDVPILRNILLVLFALLFVGSYKSRWVIKNVVYLLHTATTAYALMVIIGIYQQQFPIQSTIDTFLTIFGLGGVFKSNRTLIAYYTLSFLLITLLLFISPNTGIEKIYAMTTGWFTGIFGYFLFYGKIRALKEAKNSQSWLRNLFEKTPTSIVLINSELKVFKINQHFESKIGYSRQELKILGLEGFMETNDDFDIEKVKQLFEEKNLSEFKAEVKVTSKQGEFFWMAVTIAKVDFEEQQEQEHFAMVILDDITERKQADLKLKESAEQLAMQNRALEEFSYVISHDLQEPLRMISSFSQLIKRRYLPKLNNEEANRDFNFVIDGAQRMSKLIKDMLEYSRWTAKKFPIESIDTQLVIGEVLQNLTVAIGQNDAEIVVNDLPILDANRLVLTQVFQNLIGNSLNYRHPERKPHIEIKFMYMPMEKKWLCSIADNGRGFEERQKERIFGIFQRVHTDKAGTGMGLAICKRIIEKQGGKIWAEGVPDEGATFYFTI